MKMGAAGTAAAPLLFDFDLHCHFDSKAIMSTNTQRSATVS